MPKELDSDTCEHFLIRVYHNGKNICQDCGKECPWLDVPWIGEKHHG